MIELLTHKKIQVTERDTIDNFSTYTIKGYIPCPRQKPASRSLTITRNSIASAAPVNPAAAIAG
jgi:hypothetical protein